MVMKLVYTPTNIATSAEHPHTMVLMVDEEQFAKWKNDKSIPLAQVVDSFKVFRYENPGSEGKLVRPSKREIEDTFGTSNEDEVVTFMLTHGTLHGKTKKESVFETN